jgi:uncharacterized protein Usg
MIIFQKRELILIDIHYYLPDYCHIIQSFVWQTEDNIPELPRVHKFLNYWKINIQAKIKEVIVCAGRNKYETTNFYKVLQ